MADMNGIMAQINALRGSYGGTFGPNSVSQPTNGGGWNGLGNSPGWPVPGTQMTLEQLMAQNGQTSAPSPLNLGGQGTPSPMGQGAMGGRTPPAPRSYAPVTAMSGTPSFYDMAMYSQAPRTAPEGWNPQVPLEGLGEMADPAKMSAAIGLLPQGTDLNNPIFGSLTPALGFRPSTKEIAQTWSATGNVPVDYFSQFASPKMMEKFNRMPLSEAWSKRGQKLVGAALDPWTDPQLARGQRRDTPVLP